MSMMDCKGILNEVEEWFIKYDFSSLRQTTEKSWKWDLELDDLEKTGEKGVIFNRMTSIDPTSKITPAFLTYLEAIHRLSSIENDDLAAFTGINKHTVVNYQQKALNEQFILPYWLVSKIGIDHYYQLFISNTTTNSQLISFIESLPKVIAMKSKEYIRYLLYLPPAAMNKFDKRMARGIEEREFDVLAKQRIVLDRRTIVEGVNIAEIYQKKLTVKQ